MIREAVIHIRQRKGISLAEIHKHLETTHNKKLDGINKKMLTSTLTGLVQTGQLQKNGSNFKLAKLTRGKVLDSGKDVSSHRHHHCPPSMRFRKGYRKPSRRKYKRHRHCPRLKQRRRRSRKHHRRRRNHRHRRHHHHRRHNHHQKSQQKKHNHCNPKSFIYRRNRPVNRRGHRHCPRR